MSSLVIGQKPAIDAICPFIEVHLAGLSLPERPAGVFLLLGPTGTGKTRTVEAVAEKLHGDARKMVKVDCAEFQHDHEVAKLIGAPPGYLGHRETQPILTQAKLNQAVSQHCDLTIVLFDEIEKAAAAFYRLLLGILDKASLRTGDNLFVDFQRTLIFLTSNLGSRQMREAQKSWSPFGQLAPRIASPKQFDLIATRAAKKFFSPEFMNRVDVVVTYQPLSSADLGLILDRELTLLQEHIRRRLGNNLYLIDVQKKAQDWLLTKGTSREYGARELKRTIQREVLVPLARMGPEIPASSTVVIGLNATGNGLKFKVV